MLIGACDIHRFADPGEVVLLAWGIFPRIDDMDMDSVRSLFTSRWPSGCTVATKAMLVAAGLDDRAINAAMVCGMLHRLRRGVYVPRTYWAGLPPWYQDKLVLSGHIAATGGQHVYSHFSAARLHGLHLWDCSTLIHVNALYGGSQSRGQKDVVVHRSFFSSDVLVDRFIPGTGLATYMSLELTVLPCAMSAPFQQAVVIGDSAMHKGLNLEILQALVVMFAGIRGVNRGKAVIKALNGLSESAGETRSRLFLAQLPIPQPALQVSLDTYTGTYRIDFATPTSQALIQERERENALIENGWRFIRIKWKNLANPEQLKARIMDAYCAAKRAAA